MKNSYSFFLFGFFFTSIFLGLGTWQLQRKAEKEALIQQLEHNLSAPPYNIDNMNPPTLFQPLVATGRFLPDKTLFLAAKIHQGKSGFYVLGIFQTVHNQFLLVQRGWSPIAQATPPSGILTLEGIMRYPSPPSYFQPANSPPLYFWIDLKALSEELNLPLLPYYIVAKISYDPQILPVNPLPVLHNHHLHYAITWYCLAFSLLLMLWCGRKTTLRKEET